MVKKILDFGCGKGIISNYLTKKNKNSYIYGIDISKENIKECKKNKISENQYFKINVGNKTHFKDDYFDEVHCYEVLEHVKNVKKTLSEIKRVLKNGGRLYLSVPLEKSEKILQKYNKKYMNQIGHKRTFSKNKIIQTLNERDFAIINYKQINSIKHLYWRFLFRNKIEILDQNAKIKSKKLAFFKLINVFLSRGSYALYLGEKSQKRFIYLICILGTPFGIILDLFLIKKQQKITSINIK